MGSPLLSFLSVDFVAAFLQLHERPCPELISRTGAVVPLQKRSCRTELVGKSLLKGVPLKVIPMRVWK